METSRFTFSQKVYGYANSWEVYRVLEFLESNISPFSGTW
jgi:hypothetical protein